jgi:DNA-binding CsgD family transcriptional regulator
MPGRHVDSTCLGRSELIHAIVESLASGNHCVLSGPEGIGISTVLDQVSNRLVAQGQRPTLIRSVQSQRAFSALDPVTGGVPPEQRFDALVAQLHERSDPTRTRLPVVIIDDAHWIDDESAGVILQAVLSDAARVIVATRDETALPLALERVITMSDTRHYYVAPLQIGDMTALLSSLLVGHIEQRTVNTLIRTSAGNPSHLRALVLGSTTAGTLAPFRDTWRLTGPMHCTGAMAAVLYRSVENLDAGPRDSLDTLALTSGLDLELARQVFSSDDLEVLERDGMISVIDDAGHSIVKVQSPLLAVVLADRFGLFTRRRIYRELAERAEAPGRAATPESVLWHVRGEVAIDAVRVMAAAGDAERRSDFIVAAELAQAAYASTGGIDTAILTIKCLTAAGSEAAALELAQHALANATEPFDRAALLFHIAEENWWMGRDTQIDIASENVGEWGALLHAQQATLAILDGRLADADHTESLLDHPFEAVRITAGIAVAQIRSFRGEPERGLTLSDALLTDIFTSKDPATALITNPGIPVVGRVIAVLHSGRLSEACELAATVHRMTAEGTGVRPRAWAATMLGNTLLSSGWARRAEPMFAEAEALWADCGLAGPTTWGSTGRALSLAQQGDTEGARAALARSDLQSHTGFGLMEPFRHVAHTWIAVLDRDLLRADAAANLAIDLAVLSGVIVNLNQVVHALARLGLRDATQRAIGEAIEPVTALAKAQIGFARCWLADDEAGLHAVGDQWAAMGAPLFAAESYELSAGLYRTHRRAAEAIRLDFLAAQMLKECNSERPPDLRMRQPVGALTPRLKQVAELASKGLRNSEIAELLIINERSVESHLQRVYQRLGVASRSELASHLEATL